MRRGNSKERNVFSFYLDKNKDKDKERIQAMSDKDWQTARDRVWTLVEAEAKERGWSARKSPATRRNSRARGRR
jgi:hypothetical protein